MRSFWTKLSKPFTILAPMDGVTDYVFRKIVNKIGRPDVFFTEFTNCDAIMSPGRNAVSQNLMFDSNQKPIVAQIWGSDPQNFYLTSKYLKTLKFSGLDINMGCPDRIVTKNGAGGALIKNPDQACEIIKAVRKGAKGLPVSVKTRIGFGEEQVEKWIGFLLQQNLDALIIHLRTVKEMSKVPAHWELMPLIIKLRNKISPKTLIIGNGDISSMSDVENKYKKYGCDGFMIGTGIFQNPWVFNGLIDINLITPKKRLDLYLSHIELFHKTWGDKKNPANLKKFCKMYINNFPKAVLLREKIMQTKFIEDMEAVIKTFKFKPNHT